MDLQPGELVIGRSATCGLTIDDPLVSRSHARIIIKEDGATIEDAGSRNGIRVAGRTITGRTKLTDGVRFRIGTQELMFRELEDAAVQAPRRRSTGFMIHCTSCGLPHSTDATSCPNCGQEQEAGDDEPTTTTEQAWSIELLAETMHRAQALGRKQDIERLLVQARGVLETTSVTVDRRRLDQLADAAIRYSSEEGTVEWARWALSLYSKRGIAPGASVGAQISSLPPSTVEDLATAMRDVVKSLRPPAAGEEQADKPTLDLLRELSGRSGVA
jgi:uncharacterized Zn finger protein (UPF0148 family)